MGAVLRVEWLRVMDRQENWQERYDLDGRLVAIVGPIDRGKTSMVDCLDYLFGRQVRFKTAVFNHVSKVEARLRIGDDTFQLSREIPRPPTKKGAAVTVADVQGNLVKTLPITAKGSEDQTVSDWLLEQLGLADMFASVRLSRDKRLDFAADLLPYVRVRQEDIDRFVIRENSGESEDAREKVLRLLLFLTNEKVERIKSDQAAHESKIETEKRKRSTIKEFLGKDGLGDEEVKAEEERLHAREQAAAQRLDSLREKARTANEVTAEVQESLVVARKRLAEAEFVHENALHEQESSARLLAKVSAALEKAVQAQKLNEQEQTPMRVDFERCPKCSTDLRDRVEEPGHCRLCTEPVSDDWFATQSDKLEKEERRFKKRRTAADEALREASAPLADLRQAVAECAARVDLYAQPHVSPYVDAIAAATADLESIRGQLDVMTQFRRRQAVLDELQQERERLAGQLAKAQDEVTQVDQVMDSLNGFFGQLVKNFDLPWWTGRAWLDPETLLPLVDEQAFHQRGGGSRTAVSVAYSLTLLKHTLADPVRCALPTLLIIDSPQRNFGYNDLDAGLARRMYGQLRDYLAEVSTSVATDRYETMQLIVVDNDLPEDGVESFDRIVRFDETTGFVRDLVDPHRAPGAAAAEARGSAASGSAEAVALDGGEE